MNFLKFKICSNSLFFAAFCIKIRVSLWVFSVFSGKTSSQFSDGPSFLVCTAFRTSLEYLNSKKPPAIFFLFRQDLDRDPDPEDISRSGIKERIRDQLPFHLRHGRQRNEPGLP